MRKFNGDQGCPRSRDSLTRRDAFPEAQSSTGVRHDRRPIRPGHLLASVGALARSDDATGNTRQFVNDASGPPQQSLHSIEASGDADGRIASPVGKRQTSVQPFLAANLGSGLR